MNRLPSAGPGSLAVAPASPAPPDESVPATGASADAAATEAPRQTPAARSEVIDALRQKIARVIAREPSVQPPWKPSEGELPFFEQQTPRGPLYHRTIRYEIIHRVGRLALSGARCPDTTMLSLLALDPSFSGVDVSRALYLDTETTGLSGGTGTLVFLMGLGWFAGSGHFEVEQLLLRRPGEEGPILDRVAQRFRDSTMLVTFNGKAFDLPLVRTRFVMNRMDFAPPPLHLDLLHLARRIHRTRIGACNLGSIESKVLGFGRVDDVPSGEVSSRYAHFLRTGDEGALVGVVEHNAWDVVAMAALVSLYGDPLGGLSGEDLAGVAATLHRARSPRLARELADEAVQRGGGPAALRTRAMLCKALGDRERALADFESLLCEVDDGAVRLELAKLYEHYRKAPAAALQMVDRGTGESEEATIRRRTRLERKAGQVQSEGRRRPRRASKQQPALPGVPLPGSPSEGATGGAGAGDGAGSSGAPDPGDRGPSTR